MTKAERELMGEVVEALVGLHDLSYHRKQKLVELMGKVEAEGKEREAKADGDATLSRHGLEVE